MSRRRNRKRRKDRKERSEIATERAEKAPKPKPRPKGRHFSAKERSGDAVELNFVFGKTPFKYNPETGELEL